MFREQKISKLQIHAPRQFFSPYSYYTLITYTITVLIIRLVFFTSERLFIYECLLFFNRRGELGYEAGHRRLPTRDRHYTRLVQLYAEYEIHRIVSPQLRVKQYLPTYLPTYRRFRRYRPLLRVRRSSTRGIVSRSRGTASGGRGVVVRRRVAVGASSLRGGRRSLEDVFFPTTESLCRGK